MTATAAGEGSGRIRQFFGRTLEPLRHRNFGLLWCGQSLSAVGNQTFPPSLALSVLDLGGTVSSVGLVLAVLAFASALGALIAAAVGDRWPRTRVMIAADAIRVVAVAGIACARAFHWGVETICALVVFMGIGEGLFMPAYAAVTPKLLPENSVQAGNSLNWFSMHLAMIIGPGLAGLLAILSGTQFALAINSGTFAVSLLTLAFIREPLTEGSPSSAGLGAVRRIFQDFSDGIAAVVGRPWIRTSLITVVVVMVFVSTPSLVLLPVVARERLGGSGAYGLVLTAMGTGALCGALIGGHLRPTRSGLVAACCVGTVALAVSALALLPLPGVAVAWAIAGAGVTIFNVLWLTAIQQDVPPNLQVRVIALQSLAVTGLVPLGYGFAGPLAAVVGARALLLAGAFIVLLVAPLPLLVRGGTRFRSEPARAGVSSTAD
jgi:MFS family permease